MHPLKSYNPSSIMKAKRSSRTAWSIIVDILMIAGPLAIIGTVIAMSLS